MEPNRQEKLEELEKVLNSRTLHGSESLKAFLKFVILHSLDNGDGGLKEYTIATEVFGRGSSYDSRTDSVVRVQAGRLRSKLQEYYLSEGKADRVIIELPKGHYTPVLTYSTAATKLEPPRPKEAGSSEDSVPQPPASPTTATSATVDTSRRRMWLVIAGLAVVSVILISITLDYRADNNRLKSEVAARQEGAADVRVLLPVWDRLLKAPDPILVSFSNTLFEGTAETGMKLMMPLDKRVQGVGEPAIAPGSHDSQSAKDSSVVTDHYTGVGEVMGMYAISSLFSKAGRQFRVKRSLLLTWDDLTAANIVFLGSPAENLLLRDLPQHQDFVFRVIDPGVESGVDRPTFGIVNTKPRPGEQNFYAATQEGPSRSQISEDYALISMLRGLDEKHSILILAGITTFGTQAAAEYVSKPEYAKDLISHLNEDPGSANPRLPSYYQVLVKVKVNGGVPVQLTYVTHHVL